MTGRAIAGAQHAHPPDSPLADRQIGLLLDQEATLRIADAEPVANSLAIGEGVALKAFQRLYLIGVLEPLAQHSGDHGIGAARLPVATWSQAAEVDLGVQQVEDATELLGGKGARERDAESGRLGHAPIVAPAAHRVNRHIGHTRGDR